MRAVTRNKDLNVLNFKLWFCIFTFYFSIFTLLGCEAFVRKFTRKPKNEQVQREEMVLAPQEYVSELNKEGQYRQYFLFWKSWQDELIQSLLERRSIKKQVDCAEEAVKNLINLEKLLAPEAQKKLEAYIVQIEQLKGDLSQDELGARTSNNVNSAERIRRNILRDFSYNKIKDQLI